MIEARENTRTALFLSQYIHTRTILAFPWGFVLMGIISKTLSRCRSLGGTRKGGFSVYVGPQKERFVVRAEWANHHLFRALLDEAETEYGFDKAGPLELPCHVELFQRVAMEIMSQELDADSPRCSGFARSPLCGFRRGHAGYKLINPA